MSDQPAIPTFGAVDLDGEHGLLVFEDVPRGSCRLILVARTERGYPRRELASIPLPTWRLVATVAQRELVRGMDPEEIGGIEPKFRPAKPTGSQTTDCDQANSHDASRELALSPLVTRELAVLFWALMEDGEGTHIEALLAGWRQLAREERWWLFARASNPSQRLGSGWRRALFFALTDPADTRTAPRLLEIMESASAQKKPRFTGSRCPIWSLGQRRKPQPRSRSRVRRSRSLPGNRLRRSPSRRTPQRPGGRRPPSPQRRLRSGSDPVGAFPVKLNT